MSTTQNSADKDGLTLLRVLVVDDEPLVLETVMAILEDGFEVEACSSSTEAFKRLLHNDYDVLCTDYQMPGMSGLELVSAIEQHHLMIGAVIVTGHYLEFDRERQESPHSIPISVLLKPYRADDLISAIRRAATFAQMKRAVGAIGGCDGGTLREPR